MRAFATATIGTVTVTLGVAVLKPALVLAAVLGVGGVAGVGVLAVIALAAAFGSKERRDSALDVLKTIFGRKDDS
jgi:hypothetical protein